MDTVLTFGKSQSGVTNTRPVTSFHWTTLCAECDQADSRQLCIEKFLNQDSKRSKLFDVARRYRNVCRCVPMCADVCRCVPMCADVCQCVPMCADVCRCVPSCADVCRCVPMRANVCQCVPMCLRGNRVSSSTATF